jgi:hypothetical protein
MVDLSIIFKCRDAGKKGIFLQIFAHRNGGNKQLKSMTTNGKNSRSGVLTGSGKRAEGVV